MREAAIYMCPIVDGGRGARETLCVFLCNPTDAETSALQMATNRACTRDLSVSLCARAQA